MELNCHEKISKGISTSRLVVVCDQKVMSSVQIVLC
jgi:hypothetical protein